MNSQELQGLLETYQSELKKLAFQSGHLSKLVTDLEKKLRTALAKEAKERLKEEKAAARAAAKAAKAEAKASPKRRGRPKATVVTGYLIGDDSVMQKVRGKKMGGLGYHYSSTAEKTVKGHCLVQALYVLLGRRCPLAPQMYRTKAVCEQEGVVFQSKVDLMKTIITDFEAVVGTQTHVLLDS